MGPGPEGSRRERSRVVGVLAWGAALACLLPAGAALSPGVSWHVSLLADLAAQGVIGVALVVVVAIALRRRGPAALAGAAAIVLVGSLVASRPGAGPAPAESVSVRLLQFNVLSSNDRPGDVIDLVESSGADVVSLIEPSNGVIRLLRDERALMDSHPYRWIPGRAGAGWSVVLSRWPQLAPPALTPSPSRTVRGRSRAMVIGRPEAPFALLQIMPHSPRSPSRWAEGNESLDRAIRVGLDELLPLDLPLVVVGDLNGTPTGPRSRRLRAALGVRHTKPLLAPAGTWPSSLPWPLSLVIDDALVSPGVRVASWRALGDAVGSDHRAVLVELEIPASPGARESGPPR